MSKRFEITLNGKHFCAAGVSSFGVVSTLISWAHRLPTAESPEESLNLRVGGADWSDPTNPKSVEWGVVPLNVDDTLTVRILPPGKSTAPLKRVEDHKDSIKYTDPLFGTMTQDRDSCSVELPFSYPNLGVTTARVVVYGPHAEPTQSDRDLFVNLRAKYDELWPQIAAALVRAHPTLSSTDELLAAVAPAMQIYIVANPRAEKVPLHLMYDISPETGPEMTFMLGIRDWLVVEISSL